MDTKNTNVKEAKTGPRTNTYTPPHPPTHTCIPQQAITLAQEEQESETHSSHCQEKITTTHTCTSERMIFSRRR